MLMYIPKLQTQPRNLFITFVIHVIGSNSWIMQIFTVYFGCLFQRSVTVVTGRCDDHHAEVNKTDVFVEP